MKVGGKTITVSVIALIAANLVPLFGVLFFEWDASMIVLLYWAENVIAGFYNVLRLALVRVESPAANLGKLFTIPFFCIHFGGFCAVHGFFLVAFFELGGKGMGSVFPDDPWFGHLVFVQLLVSVVAHVWRNMPPEMAWPLAGLMISHGISFVQHFILDGEYKKLSAGELMGRPYGRIVVLHIAIIVGGFFVMALGSSLGLLLILVVLKIGLDIKLHNRSHKAATVSGEKRQ